MKQLIIMALNRAIEMHKAGWHQPILGDVVVDYDINNTRVATYLTRHPGCIMLPVNLKEGSGYVFIRVDSGMFVNKVYVAWEEDSTMHPLCALIPGVPFAAYKEVLCFFDGLVTKHI